MVNTLEEKDFVKILWEYLQTHYSQRMQMLNFFIILETVLCTGLITVFQLNIFLFKLIISFATFFFAVAFMLVDIRAKHMIKFAEKSYQFIESKYSSI